MNDPTRIAHVRESARRLAEENRYAIMATPWKNSVTTRSNIESLFPGFPDSLGSDQHNSLLYKMYFRERTVRDSLEGPFVGKNPALRMEPEKKLELQWRFLKSRLRPQNDLFKGFTNRKYRYLVLFFKYIWRSDPTPLPHPTIELVPVSSITPRSPAWIIMRAF